MHSQVLMVYVREYIMLPAVLHRHLIRIFSNVQVVGYPIDFDTASSVEGKESQVRQQSIDHLI